ncbi:hypothetical protein SDC9_133712 [bioreactor metagenome]|uniref:Uncharacterized protein n=1 Tax=bioreactor metagenome TaxID=1076179 RepID=A0A645DDH8_9ZZZZ
MLDHGRFRIVSDEIIVFIIPCQRERAHAVILPIVAVAAFFLERIFKIAKPNLFPARNTAVKFIYIIVYTLIHVFNAVGHIHLPPHKPCIINAAQTLELAYERNAFALGNKLRRLYAVHKQLELRQFKLARRYVIACRPVS